MWLLSSDFSLCYRRTKIKLLHKKIKCAHAYIHDRHRTIKPLLIHISNMFSTVADAVKLIHELFVWFSPTKFPYYCVESNWFAESGKTCVWLKSKIKRKTNFKYAQKINFCVFMGHVDGPTRWKRKTFNKCFPFALIFVQMCFPVIL